MKKSLQQLVFGSLFVAILAVGSAANAQATTKPKTADTAKEATGTVKPKRDWYPIGGIVSSVDKLGKTVSLKKKEGERVLHTDSQTKLEMDDKPVMLGSIKPGNYLSGTLHKIDGEEYILNAKIKLEAPVKKGTNTVTKAVAPVVAPVVEDTATNAVVKKVKKAKKAVTGTNAPAAITK